MRISDPAVVDRILKAIADPESTAIMLIIRKESKSAQALSQETGIPQSTVYRKLEELKSAGLVMTRSYSVSSGKKVDLVTATFSEVKMSMEEGKRSIEIVPSDETANARWLRLFRGD
jgi:DNA-binding transcriptional ArsR family regulator